MKKRKLNKLALLFAISPLTLGGIASCSATKPDQDQVVKFGTIKIKEGITNGSVVTSLTGETEIGKEVKIFAIPNEGYEVDKYFLNDEVLSGDSFITVEGDNVVFVTFKEKVSETEYGSVQILKDGVTNGKVEAFLEDGTKLDTDNRIQAVGTKVILKFEGLNECYEIKEVKLNDTPLTVTEGKCEFNVIKGKNFISATFGLIHEGQGLIKLGKEVNNATCTISNLGEYVDVDKDVTVTVSPETNYTVKSVTVNGEEVLESETENTFVFKAKEGLNTIEITVTSVAEGISIVVPEDWIKDDRVTATRYYVQVGTSFKLDVKFEPEGAYDDLVWSLAYDTDAQYIEVKKDGTINVF